jgi:hypothetical protein
MSDRDLEVSVCCFRRLIDSFEALAPPDRRTALIQTRPATNGRDLTRSLTVLGDEHENTRQIFGPQGQLVIVEIRDLCFASIYVISSDILGSFLQNERMLGGHLRVAPGGHLRVAPGGHLRVAPGGHQRVAPGGHLRVAPGGHLRVAPGGHLRGAPSQENSQLVAVS